MTVTEIRPLSETATPESQRLEVLEEMLVDPFYAGFRAEIQASIDALRATSLLGA
jgi:hypothetical protein